MTTKAKVLHMHGGTLGVVLPLANKELFYSVREGIWGGISAPLCAKGKNKKPTQVIRGRALGETLINNGPASRGESERDETLQE